MGSAVCISVKSQILHNVCELSTAPARRDRGSNMTLYFQEHHHRTCFALDACVLEVWPFWREKLPSAGPIERRCRGF